MCRMLCAYHFSHVLIIIFHLMLVESIAIIMLSLHGVGMFLEESHKVL